VRKTRVTLRDWKINNCWCRSYGKYLTYPLIFQKITYFESNGYFTY
jgi:hypothetical protein